MKIGPRKIMRAAVNEATVQYAGQRLILERLKEHYEYSMREINHAMENDAHFTAVDKLRRLADDIEKMKTAAINRR